MISSVVDALSLAWNCYRLSGGTFPCQTVTKDNSTLGILAPKVSLCGHDLGVRVSKLWLNQQ